MVRKAEERAGHDLIAADRLGAALGLLLLASSATPAQHGPVETVEFHAPSIARTMRYDIILPAGYHGPAQATDHYPTLYLLHGAGDHAGSWRSILRAATTVGDHELILVMPDAGDSYYLDWAQSDDGPQDWESYVVSDVRQHVEATYRASPRREGRAVTGYGMGGYGALVIGLRHPDRFITVGSQLGDLWWARTATERLRLEFSQQLVRLLLNADLPFVFTQRPGGRDRTEWGAMYDDAIAWHYRMMRQALDRVDSAGP